MALISFAQRKFDQSLLWFVDSRFGRFMDFVFGKPKSLSRTYIVIHMEPYVGIHGEVPLKATAQDGTIVAGKDSELHQGNYSGTTCWKFKGPLVLTEELPQSYPFIVCKSIEGLYEVLSRPGYGIIIPNQVPELPKQKNNGVTA